MGKDFEEDESWEDELTDPAPDKDRMAAQLFLQALFPLIEGCTER